MNKHATSQAKGYYQIVLGDEAPSQNQGENRKLSGVGAATHGSWWIHHLEKQRKLPEQASKSPIHVVHAALPCS